MRKTIWAVCLSVVVLSACERLPEELAEERAVMTHPFYGEVLYGWRASETWCVVWIKTGKKAMVLCHALERT